LDFRLTVFGSDRGDGRLLRHAIALQARAQTHLVRLACFHLKLGIHGLLFHLRIRKLDDYSA
jgi:hypothetical protein